MENNLFNMPIRMDSQNPISTDGTLSYMNPIFAPQSNQNQIMDGFPVLEGEPPMNNLNQTRMSDSEPVVLDSMQLMGQFVDGIPISSSSLATLLAARSNNHHETFDASSPYPHEFLKTLLPNSYSDTLNASFGCGYNGIGNFDRLIPPPPPLEPPPLPPPLRTFNGRTRFEPFQLMGNMDQNGWISSENASGSSDSPSGSSRFSNELSLSLATTTTCQPSVIYGNTMQDQFSDKISCNNRENHSYKPVQFSQLLSGSRFLPLMQEILAEIASYSLENLNPMNYPVSAIGTGSSLSDEDVHFQAQRSSFLRGWEAEVKKKQLLALLQVVDKRYNQCLDEIHTVISAFHAVTELDPSIHSHFALHAISFLYKNLRERISNQILAMSQDFDGGQREQEEADRSLNSSLIEKQWSLQQQRRKEHQIWRPQRGLPERSVSVLRAWMFQNFLHPYPKDAEKHLLAVKSGLTRSQVSNWFINARVRLWKPMIDEMYMEMNRRKRHQQQNEDDDAGNLRSLVSINNQLF